MLISMPTGTSTIFGVFQAILALLVDRTNFVLRDKVVRNEKFASEIFCLRSRLLLLHCKKSSRSFAARAQTKDGSTGSEWAVSIRMRSFGGTAELSDKELVTIPASFGR
jgi:hypothetical protein